MRNYTSLLAHRAGPVCADVTENFGSREEANTTLASKLGLDAAVLFKNPRMAIFFLFADDVGAVLQITNVFGNPFLHDFARNPTRTDSFVVKYPSILLSVSQMAEVGLLIPFLP